MKSSGSLALLVLLAATAARADVSSYEFVAPIERPPADANSVAAVRLTSDVYQHSETTLADLRIVDDAGTETPYKLEDVAEYVDETRQQPSPVTVDSLAEADGGIELVVRLPDKADSADGLRLFTGQTDFEHRVQVSGSSDGAVWQPLVDGALVFDYTRYMNIKNLDVRLPHNEYRRFKLSIGGAADERRPVWTELARTMRHGDEVQRVERQLSLPGALHIDRIESWHDVPQQRVRKILSRPYEVQRIAVEQVPAKRQTTVSVWTRREPINRLAVVTATRNYSREAAVYALLKPETGASGAKRSDAEEWRLLSRGTIANFDLGTFQKQSAELSFSQTRAPQYRVTIENQDNPPLEITGVKAAGSVQRLVFLAQPRRTYRLYFGSASARPPLYETAAVLEALRVQNSAIQESPLGLVTRNSGYGGPEGGLGRWLNNGWFLGAAVLVTVIALGWSLLRASQKIDPANLA